MQTIYTYVLCAGNTKVFMTRSLINVSIGCICRTTVWISMTNQDTNKMNVANVKVCIFTHIAFGFLFAFCGLFIAMFESTTFCNRFMCFICFSFVCIFRAFFHTFNYYSKFSGPLFLIVFSV